ncbi:DUF5999 family protein [Nocardioides daeguensis]|nr:DUF5999 family protein [Nocardioides daeguensis]
MESERCEGSTTMCDHSPECPAAGDPDCCTAHVTADHSEQGWCRLCNGVILFDDGAYLTPEGRAMALPHSA